MNGDLFPLKQAFGKCMERWYSALHGDTQAVVEFAQRGVAKCVKLAPGRMIDDVEAMIASYQKDQQGPRGANALLPVVLVAMGRDFTGTGGDWAGRQAPRKMVCLTDEPGASIYGYRQAMHDVRVQMVILAAEEMSARSLAAQLTLFFGDPGLNRRFYAKHTFGQYELQMPVMIENPDLMFAVAGQSKTMTVLVGEITLKAVIPYLDAPKPGEDNDSTANNPPGYPRVTEISVVNGRSGIERPVLAAKVTCGGD
ncbi:hypothetical protein BBI09_16680 [Stutzerimonas xanthomarina]|nr:hypothetical protein BBI09_16680 [Stutzerimonas xanthomarina]